MYQYKHTQLNDKRINAALRMLTHVRRHGSDCVGKVPRVVVFHSAVFAPLNVFGSGHVLVSCSEDFDAHMPHFTRQLSIAPNGVATGAGGVAKIDILRLRVGLVFALHILEPRAGQVGDDLEVDEDAAEGEGEHGEESRAALVDVGHVGRADQPVRSHPTNVIAPHNRHAMTDKAIQSVGRHHHVGVEEEDVGGGRT